MCRWGGYSEIYTANWVGGCYDEWDFKEKRLKRFGDQLVVLKKLENVENASRSWLEEVFNQTRLDAVVCACDEAKYYILDYLPN